MRLCAQGWAKFKILAYFDQNLALNLALFSFFHQGKKADCHLFFFASATLYGALAKMSDVGER